MDEAEEELDMFRLLAQKTKKQSSAGSKKKRDRMLARDIMQTSFFRIDAKEPVSRLFGQMIEQDQRAAVVFEGKRYLGIAHARKLLRSKIHVNSWRVRRVCSRPARLSIDEDFLEIVRKMYVSDTPILPVFAADIVGIVREEDILGVIKPDLREVLVKDLKMPYLWTVKEKDRTGKVIEIMSEDRVESLPVVDRAGKLLGVVRLFNIIKDFGWL